ncbi:cobalamin biosynthesis protein [Gallaecimonas sp. GXIMD1310]|uniref:cobalamin biosynthesis protein n=1 Tax=Gallaecimonas sp. GXIMD1310 TaxID=3131926 RepID=UPI0032467DF3
MNWPELLPLLAWPASRWLPANALWHSLQRLARQLASKVNHGDARYRQQAGILATLLVMLPLLALLWLLQASAELQELVHVIGFYLALSDARPARLAALAYAGKQQGRQWLASICRRDTQSLSEQGLFKAAIEAQWRISCERLLLVLLGGLGFGLAALALRAFWQLTDSWHPAQPAFHSFGYWPQRLARGLRLLAVPLALFWLILPLSPSALLRRPWPLAPLANALQCQLGGPLKLAGRKISRPRLGPPVTPTSQQLLRLGRLATGAELGTVLIICVLLLAI